VGINMTTGNRKFEVLMGKTIRGAKCFIYKDKYYFQYQDYPSLNNYLIELNPSSGKIAATYTIPLQGLLFPTISKGELLFLSTEKVLKFEE
jgi:hypothetical protein